MSRRAGFPIIPLLRLVWASLAAAATAPLEPWTSDDFLSDDARRP